MTLIVPIYSRIDCYDASPMRAEIEFVSEHLLHASFVGFIFNSCATLYWTNESLCVSECK